MKKILVYGYFGYENNQLDGQTIKTRNIYELFKNNELENNLDVNFFDTQILKIKRFAIFKMIYNILNTNTLVYIGARNNLTYVFPFIFILSKIFKIQIIYIAVGGWLDQYSSKPLHFWMLKNIKGIYLQTQSLTKILSDQYNFKNVYYLHNFRKLDNNIENKKVLKDSLNLVFMARIQPQKGVNTIFKLDKKLKECNYNNITIDIYGQIQKDFEESFFNQLKNSTFIKYKNFLKPKEINSVLSNYDLMLFPTQYYTEGFPGSILDSYLAGVPVITSRWKFANEFVKEGVSGITTEFLNEEDFINNTLQLINDNKQLINLKEMVKIYSKNYSPEAAWKILKDNI